MSVRDLEKEKEMTLASDLNADTLRLHIGQTFHITRIGRDGIKDSRKAEIRKFYKNHVLCRINGRFRECYSYSELAGIISARNEDKS